MLEVIFNIDHPVLKEVEEGESSLGKPFLPGCMAQDVVYSNIFVFNLFVLENALVEVLFPVKYFAENVGITLNLPLREVVV